MPLSNFIQAASQTENTPQLQAFWLRKYQELLQKSYFVLNSKTVELLEETSVARPATPFGDLVLPNHLEDGEVNENLLQENIETAVRLLDALLEVIKFDSNSRKIVNQYRKIGLGVSGFTDYYKQLSREKSESEEIDYVGNLISNNVYRSSESLSEEKGVCASWDNIKKALRDKPFEYWYNTETGDIKSSTEMSQLFDQKRAESSDFEIVPRRNSNLLLFPPVKEWQTWSDRDIKMEMSRVEPESQSNLAALPQTLTMPIIEDSVTGQDEAKKGLIPLTAESQVSSEASLSPKNSQFSEFGSSASATVISFPKNLKTVQELRQHNLATTDDSASDLTTNSETDLPPSQETSPISFEGFGLPTSIETAKVQTDADGENPYQLDTDQESLVNSDENKTLDSSQDSNKNLPSQSDIELVEAEKANQHNFFEPENQVQELAPDLETESEKTEIAKNESQEAESEAEPEVELAKLESLEKDTNDLQNKLHLLAESSVEKDEPLKDSDQVDYLENSHKEIGDLEDHFQLGELVKITKTGSPLSGQIHQIISLVVKPDQQTYFELSQPNISSSESESAPVLWTAGDLQSVDLHQLLSQINDTPQKSEAAVVSKNLEVEKNLGLDKLASSQKINEMTQINESLQKEQTKLLAENQHLKSEIIKTGDEKSDSLKETQQALKEETTKVEELTAKLAEVQQKNQELTEQISQKDEEIAKLQEALQKQNNQAKLESPNSKLSNLQAATSNQFSPVASHSPYNPSSNFFPFSNQIITFMSKYSLQLQQLASTSGAFQLGDILITLQYDGSGIKLVSASGDKMSKELKHMVDIVLGIVNKALSFGVPVRELAEQMKTLPKDDVKTELDFILETVANLLSEAPDKPSNFKTDNLLEIRPEDIKTFTENPGSSAISILKQQLSKLQNSKPDTQAKVEKPAKDEKSDIEESPKNKVVDLESSPKEETPKALGNSFNDSESEEEKSKNNAVNFNRNSQPTEEENPFASNQNSAVESDEKEPKDEEKLEEKSQSRSFFGGFGGRN